jgi:hypothetical protein
VDVVNETVIDRPEADVSAYAAEPENAPAWYATIESAKWNTPALPGWFEACVRGRCFLAGSLRRLFTVWWR